MLACEPEVQEKVNICGISYTRPFEVAVDNFMRVHVAEAIQDVISLRDR